MFSLQSKPYAIQTEKNSKERKPDYYEKKI